MELIKESKRKLMYTLKETAEKLGADIEQVKDLIDCGELTAVGSKKELVKFVDLSRFINGEIALVENEERPIDLIGYQRYPHTNSNEIKDLSDEEWVIMEKAGVKEIKAYWNEQRKKWCMALSLGYDENHKRMRKVITADTQQELWVKHGEFQCENKVLPVEETAPVIYSAFVKEPKHPKAEMCFKDYITEYLESIDGRDSSRTFDTKVNASRHITEALGNYKMCEIDCFKLSKFINSLTQKNYGKGGKSKPFSQSSINKIYDILSVIIRYASSLGGGEIITKGLMEEVKKPRSKAYKDKKNLAFKREEYTKISEIIKENNMMHVWVNILMYLGLRPSEGLALKFSDVDYESGMLNIERTLSHEIKHDVASQKRKGVSIAIITDLKNVRDRGESEFQIRKLKIGKNLLSILKNWEEEVKGNTKLMQMKCKNGTEEFLFCGSKGQMWKYSDYSQVYERLLKKHGLNVSEYNLYKFRHSFCTECFRKNINLKTVQMLMGDNDGKMVTRIYANMNKEDLHKGGETLSEHIDSILEGIR
ncbi:MULTISPECIES: tyrosine-type recombinase/integrase [Clostridium]|uniref:Site-specific integrase n=1 Tax=Clostridium frigoriphilum TaxID=443253 RepID=A0ABU7UWK6_9CLOT|nr:site-specific integrase [Clostridium sp. DSM 17811]MBU3101908.1 site-specific integrase [Clostridium sp. DSM 17811]